jgi:hypothetical protein
LIGCVVSHVRRICYWKGDPFVFLKLPYWKVSLPTPIRVRIGFASLSVLPHTSFFVVVGRCTTVNRCRDSEIGDDGYCKGN